MEEAVVKFLAGLHIHVKLNWLKAVILFAKLHGVGDEEVTLCNAVVEQLLHSDLSDSYEPLTKVPVVAVKAVIVKQMIFQNYLFRLSLLHVVSVVNTARSCYDQYRECINNEDDLSWFYGDEDENGPEQQSPDTKQLESPGRRRMLKIRLFDGQNTVHAIEYGGKLALDENTLPGTKVLNGDIDGKPIDLKSLFAERLGIKQDVKGQRSVCLCSSSTISPFLVRIPRIPNQGIHNRETTTQDTNDVKKEVYDSERTAVVPPLQNNLAPAAVVPPLHNNFVQKSTFVPSRIQKKLLLPFDESSSGSNAASAAIEVETELRERDEVKDEDILLLHNMATPPNTRKNIPPALNSSPATSNATVKAEDPIGTEIFAGMEETVMMTTQELINSSSPEISSLQNDSDLISFIANSLSKEVNVQVMKSLERLDLVFSLEVYPEKFKLPLLVNITDFECACRDSDGQLHDFCYRLPQDEMIRGRRFSCEHMVSAKALDKSELVIERLTQMGTKLVIDELNWSVVRTLCLNCCANVASKEKLDNQYINMML
uniref:RMI1_N domain-containing protein n=1 Tax=Angiostrongylus cantonensis TaxID=6313 RepID=A0A0K0CVF1_ANGCA